jgi:uncharacterized membrane protein
MNIKVNFLELLKRFLPLTLILAIGIFFRFYHLGIPSLWLDEAFNYWVVNQSWPEMFKAVAADNHPPLYYILLKLWVELFGSGEWALRALSGFLNTLTLVFLWAWAVRLTDRKTGLIAVLIYAVSSSVLLADMDVKNFALLVLLATAANWAYTKVLQEDSKLDLFLYFMLMTLALYTHYLALFLLLAQVLGAFFYYTKTAAKKILASALAAVLLFLPWAPTLWVQLQQKVLYHSFKATFSSFTVLLDIFSAFNGWLTYELSSPGCELMVLLYLLIAAWGAYKLLKRRAAIPLWLFAFSLVFLIVYFMKTRSLYELRYFTFLLPVYLIILASGVTAPKSGLAKILLLAAVLLPQILVLPQFKEVSNLVLCRFRNYNYYWNGDWRSVAKLIEQRQKNGDVVLFEPQTLIYPFNYYYQGGKVPLKMPNLFKAERKKLIYPLEVAAQGVSQYRQSGTKDCVKYPRVWLVHCFSEGEHTSTAIKDWLAKHRRNSFGVLLDSYWLSGKITVLRFENHLTNSI